VLTLPCMQVRKSLGKLSGCGRGKGKGGGKAKKIAKREVFFLGRYLSKLKCG